MPIILLTLESSFLITSRIFSVHLWESTGIYYIYSAPLVPEPIIIRMIWEDLKKRFLGPTFGEFWFDRSRVMSKNVYFYESTRTDQDLEPVRFWNTGDFSVWFGVFVSYHRLGLGIEARVEGKWSAKHPVLVNFRKLNKAISSLSVVPGTILPPQHYSPGMKKLGFGPFSFLICQKKIKRDKEQWWLYHHNMVEMWTHHSTSLLV